MYLNIQKQHVSFNGMYFEMHRDKEDICGKTEMCQAVNLQTYQKCIFQSMFQRMTEKIKCYCIIKSRF